MERMAEWTYYLIYNYHGVSLSAAVFRVLSTTCISKLTPDIYIYIERERERERERKSPGMNSVGLDIMGQLLIRYPAFVILQKTSSM